MKKIDHKIHGTLYKPESFSDLLSFVSSQQDESVGTVWMWRGQSNIDWKVDSSAYRRLTKSTNYQSKDNNSNLIRYENHLLEHATHKGFRHDNGRMLTDFELLAKLQHHGAATRLVDFSRSVLIGLWFASAEHPENSGLLIAFNTWFLNGYEKQLESRTYDEICKNLTDGKTVTWEPPKISPRIAVQHSQFIYSKVSDDQKGSLCFPEKYLLFEITPQLKKDSLKVLAETFDIDQSTLFPDFDGFSQANSVFQDITNMFRW